MAALFATLERAVTVCRVFMDLGTVEQEATEGTENVFSVLFVGSGSGFIFFASWTLVGRFGFDRQVADARAFR